MRSEDLLHMFRRCWNWFIAAGPLRVQNTVHGSNYEIKVENRSYWFSSSTVPNEGFILKGNLKCRRTSLTSLTSLRGNWSITFLSPPGGDPSQQTPCLRLGPGNQSRFRHFFHETSFDLFGPEIVTSSNTKILFRQVWVKCVDYDRSHS